MIRKQFQPTIYKRLLLVLFLFGFLPMGLITAVGYQYFSKVMFELLSYTSLQTLNQGRDHIDKLFEGIEDVLLKISVNPDAQEILIQKQLNEWDRYSQSRNFSDFAQIMKIGHPEIYNITIMGFEGIRMDSLGHVLPFDIVPEPYRTIMEQIRVGKTGVSKIYKNRSGDSIISFGKLMTDVNTGKKIGTIIVDMDLNSVRQDLGSVQLLPSSQIVLLSHDMDIIYHPTLATGKKLSVATFYPHGNNNFVLQKDKNDKTFLYLRTSLKSVDWTLYGIVPYEIVIEKFSYIRYYFFGFVLLLLFVIGLVSVSLRRLIVIPIRTLQRLMGKVGVGETYVRANFNRKDEIGDLANSFNGMITKINELIQQVYLVRLNESKALLLQKEADLRSLQSQITPHFLYNTLNSISWVASRKGVREIEQIVYSLSTMLKYSLENTGKSVKLKEELHYIERYFEIVNFRFGGYLDLELRVPKRLEDALIPRLSIQPIVENAIKHAFNDQEGNAKIIVSVDKDENDLIVMVKDNGKGIAYNELERLKKRLYSENYITDITSTANNKGSNVGLYNVHQRLNMLFGDPYGLKIRSNPEEGTSVCIRLPIVLLEE
jgi:two-component system sensor histidine kinase YesM